MNRTDATAFVAKTRVKYFFAECTNDDASIYYASTGLAERRNIDIIDAVVWMTNNLTIDEMSCISHEIDFGSYRSLDAKTSRALFLTVA